MGRKLMRVDLGNPPKMGLRWHGYVNPFYDHRQECRSCRNGYSKAAAHYQDQWYGNAPFDPVEYGAKPLSMDDEFFREAIKKKIEWSIELANRDGKDDWYTQGGSISLDIAISREMRRMFDFHIGQWSCHLIQADVDALLAAGRLHDLTSEWKQEIGWVKKPGVVVTAEQVNAWSISGVGHDSINCWVCVKARCERNGEPHTCEVCDGTGDWWPSEEMKAKAESWESFDPPIGDGYQIWETVSEGSPVSPAFAKPEDLANWMVQNDKSVTKDADFDAWMKFIDAGWAPSGVATDRGYVSGVEYVGHAV